MDRIGLTYGIWEVLLRLSLAMLVGGALGLNRELHGKPAGVRTHALVSIGAALITLITLQLSHSSSGDLGAVSRSIQGIITGIGFIGAGVILRDDLRRSVHGLTTAATIWLVASLGMACGLGQWRTALATLGVTLFVLVFGGPVERFVHGRLHPGEPMGCDEGEGPLK